MISVLFSALFSIPSKRPAFQNLTFMYFKFTPLGLHFHNGYKISQWFVFNAEPVRGLQHLVSVGCFADISEKLFVSIFMVWLKNRRKCSVHLDRRSCGMGPILPLWVWWTPSLPRYESFRSVYRYKHFGGSCCFHLQASPFRRAAWRTDKIRRDIQNLEFQCGVQTRHCSGEEDGPPSPAATNEVKLLLLAVECSTAACLPACSSENRSTFTSTGRIRRKISSFLTSMLIISWRGLSVYSRTASIRPTLSLHTHGTNNVGFDLLITTIIIYMFLIILRSMLHHIYSNIHLFIK